MLRSCTFSAVAVLAVLVVPKSAIPASPQALPRTRTTVPREVRAACDEAFAIAKAIPGVTVTRRTGSFRDEVLRTSVFGCGIAISGSFARAGVTGDAAVRLREGFLSAAWNAVYSAMAPTGRRLPFVARRRCLVRGTWDGGAAGEPQIPSQDWYRVVVFCTTPAFPESRSER
jgi:hypothetical protein